MLLYYRHWSCLDGSSELLTYITRASLLLSPEDNSNSGSATGSGSSAGQQYTLRVPCVALLSTDGLALCTLGDRRDAVAELIYELADVNEVRVFPGGGSGDGSNEPPGTSAAPVVEFHLTLNVSEPATQVPSPPPPFPSAPAAAQVNSGNANARAQHRTEAAVLRVELAQFALPEALALLHLFSLVKYLQTRTRVSSFEQLSNSK